MLSHLGYVTIPTPILEKRTHEGNNLTQANPKCLKTFQPSPKTSLVTSLDWKTSSRSSKPHWAGGVLSTISMSDEIAVSAAILRAVTKLDDLQEKGYGRNEAIGVLQSQKDFQNLTVVDQLKILKTEQSGTQTRRMSIDQIRVGMILNEPIKTDDGLTVAPAGFRVNDLIRQLLKNLKLQGTIPEIVEVMIEDVEE